MFESVTWKYTPATVVAARVNAPGSVAQPPVESARAASADPPVGASAPSVRGRLRDLTSNEPHDSDAAVCGAESHDSDAAGGAGAGAGVGVGTGA